MPAGSASLIMPVTASARWGGSQRVWQAPQASRHASLAEHPCVQSRVAHCPSTTCPWPSRSPLAAMTVTRRAELPLLLLASAARLWPPNCCLLPFRKLLPKTGRLLLLCCGALTALLAGRSTAAPVMAAMLPS